MSVLIDTNILLRSAEPKHAQYRAADAAVAALLGRGEQLCIVPQVLYEFWVVATRPLAHNGLAFTGAQATLRLARILSLFPLLDETAEVFARWRHLVEQHDTRGKSAHDAHLVAAMLVHDVGTILTFNKPDFVRYPQISVIAPEELLGSPAPPSP